MSGAASENADLAVINGRVWTGLAGDAEAVAVSGGRVVAVGMVDEVRAAAGSRAQVIDADGRRIIPGICDAHTHLLMAGLQLSRLELRYVRGRAEFVERVGAVVAGLPAGRWVLGGGYAVEHWPVPEPPHRSWIDPVTPDHPVYLTRADLHQGMANTRALALAGITRHGPPDPPGGHIERDPHTGEPTGILKSSAMELIECHVPTSSEADRFEAVSAVLRQANRWGITSVHDMSSMDELATLRRFYERWTPLARVHSYVYAGDMAAAWPEMRKCDTDDPWLRVMGFKTFVDGSLGSRSAHMRDPYNDATADTKYPCGLREKHAADWDAFTASLRWAHEQGTQLAVHAIGDQAIGDLLDVYAGFPGVVGRRHRIEHVQHLSPDDVERFAELGVIASMQPIHKLDDGSWAAGAIGNERMEMMYAWGSLLRAGVEVCFGSDTPVATNNPFAGMVQAATGRMPDGSVCAASQNIALEQALRCYTVTPPYAVFRNRELGTIEVGKLADLAILDRDILSCDMSEVEQTQAHLTIVGGRIVWSAEAGAAS